MKPWISLLFVAVAVALSGDVQAQIPVSTLLELQNHVTTGETITVIDNSGQRIVGQLSNLTASALEMNADGKDYTFTSTNLKEVSKRRHDSLLNGILIGGLIGSSFLIALVASDWCSDEGPGCGGGYAWSAAFIAIGAGAGAGIDAMRMKQLALYRSPSLSLGIMPQLGLRSKSVSVSLKF